MDEQAADAVIAIRRAFAEADIQIPFPIRTLDFPLDGAARVELLDGESSAAEA